MRRLLTVLTIALVMTSVVSAAGKYPRGAGQPHRYLPESLDQAIAQIENTVDGRTWSAWSYRNGGEYDLALSVSTTLGIWSEPLLIGLDDGLDQREPALAVDARGAVYVAYGDGAGAIRIMALQPGGSQWTAPATVAMEDDRFSAPSLMVVGNSLIVGYRDGDGVALQALPLLQVEVINQMRSIYDGPDPTTGQTEEEGNKDAPSRDEPEIRTINNGGGVTIRPVFDSGSNDDD